MNTMVIMVEISSGSYDDVIMLLFVHHLTLIIILLLSLPKTRFIKGHVKVYRTPVDELLQFHQLK
jgi:hypothetical protein